MLVLIICQILCSSMLVFYYLTLTAKFCRFTSSVTFILPSSYFHAIGLYSNQSILLDMSYTVTTLAHASVLFYSPKFHLPTTDLMC